MATKKYVLKTEQEKYADGTNNEEHIRDIISQVEISFENIQDNNDVCLQVYKVKQAIDTDKDTLDAISIACENSIEIEKQAGDVLAVVEQVKDNLDKYGKSNEEDLQNLLKQMQKYEKQSRKIMEGVM